MESNGEQTADEIRSAVLQLSEKHGAPGIDLAHLVLSLADLDLIPLEIARRHAVLPILVKDEAIFLAMADPSDKRVIEEIEFISGKRVFPYASARVQLVSTIDLAYQMHHQGEQTLVGDRAAKGSRASVAPLLPSDRGSSAGSGTESDADFLGERTVMTEAVTPVPVASAVAVPAVTAAVAAVPSRPSPPAMRSVRPTILSVRDDLQAPPSSRQSVRAPLPPFPPPLAHARAVMFEPLTAPTLLPEAPPSTVPAPPDSLPISSASVTDSPKPRSYPAAPSPALKVRSALVIDVHDDSRRLLASALEDLGLTVLEASRGAAAITIAEKQSLELVVLDPSLPDLHGFDLCRSLAGVPSMAGVPVVMLSECYRGWRFSWDVRTVFGVRAFIEKPFSILDFAAKIESVLAGTDLLLPQPEALEPEVDGALRMANEAYRRGELDLAISHLERGVVLAPSSSRVHYQLALLLGRRGDVFRAITALETSVGLNDSFFPALKNLAVLYDKAGFVRKAVESWERALWAAPDLETHKQIKERLFSLL